jgi:Tfp pilus assembly protein PilF
MMNEFKNLINNLDNLNSTDYSLAIYYALINWENKIANKWTSKALQLYPKNDVFYWYKWWIYKDAWDYEKAEYYLNEWLKLNLKNPLINLNLGIIEANKWNFLKAKIYLKNTIKEDTNWDFWKFASKKLKEVLFEEKNLENEIQDL